MPQFSYGITKVEMGTKGALDVMGTTLAAIGKTFENSCTFNVPEPETKEFYSEENDAPEVLIKKQQPAVLEFEVMDMDTVSMLAIFGGTVTGTTPKVYEPPLVAASVEKSVKVTMTTGNILNIPRGVINGTIQTNLSKNDLWRVKVQVKAYKPASTALAPWNMSFAT